MLDGNITPDKGRRLREIDASRFVAGTSSIFKGNIDSYKNNISTFRGKIF